ncbi:EKC/KEOPS complex subunit LAGE3 [Halichoerus grypus]
MRGPPEATGRRVDARRPRLSRWRGGDLRLAGPGLSRAHGTSRGQAGTLLPRSQGWKAEYTLEAEIACGSLAPDAEPHGGAVEKQLTVSGSVMAVRWRAKDPRLLRISIMTFLDQLSLVMQTMRRFGPPVSR